MENFYLISTKLDPGSVIDKKMHSGPSVGLQVFPVNQPETDNQLWKFIPDPAGSGFYFIKSKVGLYVIDVKGGKASDRGTPLQIHIQNESGFDDNQLWEFVPDPIGSGYYLIKSKLGDYVIEIKGGSAAPHTPLQVFPQGAPGPTDNQLWICRPGPEGSFSPKITLLAADSSGIRIAGDGFVALNRISLWCALTDPVSGVRSSIGSDPVFAPSTARGAFQYLIPTQEPRVSHGSILEITAADGTNRLAVKASFDGESKSWNLM